MCSDHSVQGIFSTHKDQMSKVDRVSPLWQMMVIDEQGHVKLTEKKESRKTRETKQVFFKFF